MAESPSAVRHRWFQFRLRTLLLLVALLAIPLALFCPKLRRAELQRAAVAKLWDLNYSVKYAPNAVKPEFVRARELLGPDFFDQVVAVAANSGTGEQKPLADNEVLRLISSLRDLKELDLQGDRRLDGGDIALLASLSKLRSLNLCSTKFRDDGLVCLAGMPELEHLDLSNSPVTDAGLGHLQSLHRLKTLCLKNTGISGDQLERLNELACLEELDISKTNLQIADLGKLQLPLLKILHAAEPRGDQKPVTISPRFFEGLPSLESLDICGCFANSEILVAIARLSNLKRLDLVSTGGAELDLQNISHLSKLGELHLEGIRVGDAGLRALAGLNKSATVALVSTNSIGMKLAYIPAGEFVMGSPDDNDRCAGYKQHRVRVTKPFYMGVDAVTQEEYEKVMGENPSEFSPLGARKKMVQGLETKRFPVENVSWNDAQKFCTILGKMEGKRYRLPTEAEWEYACRAGTTTAFAFGDSLSGLQANINGEFNLGAAPVGPFLRRPTAVGSYPPNAWGLCDMHGNVYQWCQDWYDENYYSRSPLEDPAGPAAGSAAPAVGSARVVRGGCWCFTAYDCGSASRYRFDPATKNSSARKYDGSIGFRIVEER